MSSISQIEDKELGILTLKSHSRARRFTFRPTADGIVITLPQGTSVEEFWAALEKVRPRLRLLKEKCHTTIIDLNYTLSCDYFKLSLVEGKVNRFLASSGSDTLTIVCPIDTDFRQPILQEWLRKVISEALRCRAKEILPQRLRELSLQSGLSYKSIRINGSRSRWGSCSTAKNINLSYYLLLLPTHLIDYVLLHELAHTQEMNHGEKFWALLHRLTDGKAQLLRTELKNYKTGI